MLGLDHIGLLTRDVDKATAEFARAIGSREATPRFDDEGLTVSVRFLRGPDGIVYEMIAPLGENSIVAGALRKGVSIINQLAYRTASISEDIVELKAQGFMPLGPRSLPSPLAVRMFSSCSRRWASWLNSSRLRIMSTVSIRFRTGL